MYQSHDANHRKHITRPDEHGVFGDAKGFSRFKRAGTRKPVFAGNNGCDWHRNWHEIGDRASGRWHEWFCVSEPDRLSGLTGSPSGRST